MLPVPLDWRHEVQASSQGWAVLLLLLVACGGTATPKPSSDTDGQRRVDDAEVWFAERVAPVLERRCSGVRCHGSPPGQAHDFGTGFYAFPTDNTGKIGPELLEDARLASLAKANTSEGAHFSTLVRKALPPSLGGLPHEGGHPWAGPEDPECRDVLAWIEAEEGGGESPDEGLGELEQLFVDTALPALERQRCLTDNCHGPNALLTTFRLDPGVFGSYSTAQLRKNYASAKKHLHLDGDVRRSRLLVKALPLSAGGVLHKGGNSLFLTSYDDPDARALLDWMKAEQRAAHGRQPELGGLVFVAGASVPAGLFDVTAPRGPADLYTLIPATPNGQLTNITERLHDGRADIRDPAVSADGTTIVFAMARPGEALNLYQIGVDGSGFRQLTADPPVADSGVPIANVEPVYGPEGRIYFTSTRSGELGDRGELPNTDIWELDPDSGELRRRTWGPNQELRPTFLRVGGVGGEMAFTSTRQFGELYNAPIFRFPPALATEYHVHFGTQRPETLFAVTDTPSGLHIVVLTDRDNVWHAGSLALIDRNFGPDILDESMVAEASLPRFAHTLTNLTPESAWTGLTTDGQYRDPAPLPDGRLVVSYAPGTFDGASEQAAVAFSLQTLSIAFDEATGRAYVAERLPLISIPGRSLVSPAAIARRVEVPTRGHHEDWSSPTGTINMFNLPLLQAIVETLEPTTKTLREDLAFVRILAAAPPQPWEMDPVDPSDVRNGDDASNTITNGIHDRARVLGTVPLGPDGSFHVEIPANVPVRFQALNADKMAVGHQHDRWIFANPGEVLFHATDKRVYRQRCAGCHGALSGRPEDSLGVLTDVVSSASVSHSTHQNGDALQPIDPVAVELDVRRAPVVDFLSTLQPILDRSCATTGCHGEGSAAGGLSLSGTPTTYYNDAYESLMAWGDRSGGGKDYVDERNARAWSSFLIERLTGRELGAPGVVTGRCPPPGTTPALSQTEIDAFITWIDTGAVFVGANP